MVIQIVCCVIAGYLLGCFSTSFLIGRKNNMDIREHGSGNAGTTNAFRTMGKRAGVLTFTGDFLKAFIPLMIMKYFIFKDIPYLRVLMLVFGIGCVLGHNYPFWLGFKGGKGIASSGGVFVAFDPLFFIPGALVFGGFIFITKYVSVGSLLLSLLFPIWVILRCKGDPYYTVLIILACVYTLSAFIRHRSNIGRLIHGTENKVGSKKSKD